MAFRRIAFRPVDILRVARRFEMRGEEIILKNRNEIVLSAEQLKRLKGKGIQIFHDPECQQELDIQEAYREVMQWHAQGNALKCQGGWGIISSIYNWAKRT